MSTDDDRKKRRTGDGGDTGTGDVFHASDGDDGEGCLGCLLLPFKAGWVVIKGIVGLVVKIGDAFADGDGD